MENAGAKPTAGSRQIASVFHSPWPLNIEHTSYGQLWLSIRLDNFWFGIGTGARDININGPRLGGPRPLFMAG